MDQATVERFYAKVNKRGPVHPKLGPCHVWTGAVSHSRGRGTRHPAFSISGKTTTARRVAWMIAHGPIKPNWSVVSVCGRDTCVNPDHMKLVPRAQGRDAQTRTHCPRGHELTPINTFVATDGRRVCRLCQALMASDRRRGI